MKNPEQYWCPLINANCRKDCAWCHDTVSIDEDGCDKDWWCLVQMAASDLISILDEQVVE